MPLDYYNMEGQPVPFAEWASTFENHENRRVGSDHIGEVHVSTVLLGFDHAWGDGPPIIFETMVFGLDDEHEYQWRYATKEQAAAAHAKILAAVRDGTITPDFDPS